MLKTLTCLSLAFVVAAPIALRGAAPVPAPAPAWQLLDPNGVAVSSSQFKGKVMVVDFWATWCPPCRSEIPGYVDLQRKYGKDGLAVIGISLDQEGPEVVRKFVDRYAVAYTILMADDQVAGNFGVGNEIPTTYIVDRSGNIRYHKVGAMPREEFESVLLPILREQPAPAATGPAVPAPVKS